ncbi:MAG: division/cell wall cluster transcriptional repressor MraZ, partial [Pseudomonadota bacterium]|nr:division/cell wall cluster transcriptional repressor MraZ [Pseudomonadota bacterium]
RERLAVLCGGHMVVTIDTEERSLLIYPVNEWEEIEAKITSLPTFDPRARRIQRLLVGHATDVEIDGSGRILLPAALREYAGLEKETVLIGQGKKLELWSKDSWEGTRDEYLEQVNDESQLSEQIMSISL